MREFLTWIIGIILSIILTIILVQFFFSSDDKVEELPQVCPTFLGIFFDPTATIEAFSTDDGDIFCMQSESSEGDAVCLDSQGNVTVGLRLFKVTEENKKCLKEIYKTLQEETGRN